MITLHHLNNSRSQRILWMLEEIGLRDWIFDIDEPADAPRLLESALKIHQCRKP